MSVAPFVTRWDLDKTYLRTEFDTLSDLLRTAMERPDQKRAVPGASALLGALGDTGARIHILSGSPRQLRSRLEEKLRLDGVRWDELTLKPNLSNMLRLRFRALRDQLGYKLPILLAARVRDQDVAAEEILVGDDAEADAFVYSLYGDLCDGTVSGAALEQVLTAGNVYGDQRESIRASLGAIRKGPVVARILIHLDRQSPPSHFELYGSRVVPFYNYLQAAMVLLEDGRLGAESVLKVAHALARQDRFEGVALARSYLDLLRRGHARGTAPALLRAALPALEGEPAEDVLTFSEMVGLMEGYVDSPPRPKQRGSSVRDYVELATRHQGGKNRKKIQGFA